MTRPARLALGLAAVLWAAPAFAQTRDTRPSATRGSGTISGTVVSDDTERRPVRRVRVTCGGPDVANATAITDDRGRFVFTGLKAGRYTITGARDAWVPVSYGAKRPLRPGSAIPLADGQSIVVVLKMLRGAVITGVVLDHYNQPAANTGVAAFRYVMQNGERRLNAAGSGATTDDRGVYRIYGLAPGQYLVGAQPRTTVFNGPSSELRLVEGRGVERTVAFASTYFPGTPVEAQAVLVTVGAGEERDGVDFALQLVATARVEGTVTTPEGLPAPTGTQVNLMASAQQLLPGTAAEGLRSSRVGTDGAFVFSDVSPGSYTVLARSAPPVETAAGITQIAWASTDIVVDGENVTGLSLGLRPGMTLTGQLKFAGTRLKPPTDLTSIRLALQPVQSRTAVNLSPPGKVVDQSGHFVVTGIIPGRYRLAASLPGLGQPGNWYLGSSVVNGQDTLDLPIVIQPNESIRGAVITLTDRPAQLTGTVQNAAGGAANEFTVILFPVDQALWQPLSRRIRGLRPSADGAFAFRGLPPGDYLLAAIDDVEPGEWFDPAFLQRLLPTAMKLAIAEGENKVQDIRLGGGG